MYLLLNYYKFRLDSHKFVICILNSICYLNCVPASTRSHSNRTSCTLQNNRSKLYKYQWSVHIKGNCHQRWSIYWFFKANPLFRSKISSFSVCIVCICVQMLFISFLRQHLSLHCPSFQCNNACRGQTILQKGACTVTCLQKLIKFSPGDKQETACNLCNKEAR